MSLRIVRLKRKHCCKDERTLLMQRYTVSRRSAGVRAIMARNALLSNATISSRFVVSEIASNVATRNAYGTGAPAFHVARASRSNDAWAAAAAMAPLQNKIIYFLDALIQKRFF